MELITPKPCHRKPNERNLYSGSSGNICLSLSFNVRVYLVVPFPGYGAIAALCITSLFKASTINPGRVPVSVDKDNKGTF